MDQVSIKSTNIFHCKTRQNVPKFGFLDSGVNPTIMSYNASTVKIYNATSNLVRFYA
jgi:hypothetical protein